MARLYIFPESGWCSNAPKDLGKFLAKRYNMDYEPPGENGYAWNSGSFWTIRTESGKISYDYDEILHFVVKDDITSGRPIVAKKNKGKPKIKHSFVVGDFVMNMSDKYGGVIPEGWTGHIVGFSQDGYKAYVFGSKNVNKDKNIQFDIKIEDLSFVETTGSRNAGKKQYFKDVKKALEFYDGQNVIIEKNGIAKLRQYPLMPDECYPAKPKDFADAISFKNPFRTKRSKREFKQNMDMYMGEFLKNPCRELYLSDEIGQWETSNSPKWWQCNLFDIKTLQRRRLLLRRRRR